MNIPHLTPGFTVLVASLVSSFLLKTSAAYLLCVLLARLGTSPERRFKIWLAYISGTCFYLIYAVQNFASNRFQSITAPSDHVFRSAPELIWPMSPSVAELFGQIILPLLLCYCASIVCLLFLGSMKRLRLQRALTYRAEPPGWMADQFEYVRLDMNVRSTKVWLLAGIGAPASLGFWKPGVYLPSDCVTEPEAELSRIFRHELAHVKRHDNLWDSAARLCRCVLFFHPLVHRGFEKLRLERELACDMVVVRSSPEECDQYAETLLRFGWKTAIAETADDMGIGFASQSKVLNARVKTILAGRRRYSAWSRGARLCASFGASGLFAILAPPLWFVFGMSAVAPLPQSTVSRFHLASTFRPHPRRMKSRVLTEKATPPGVSELSPSTNAQAVRTVEEPRPKGFHIQNEDEPMFNPEADPEPADSDLSSSARAPKSMNETNSIPVSSSVLVDAAATLGRVALSGDHDHGKD